MPDLTPRYNLKKPVQDGSETADLRVWVGENMDLLDVALGHVEDKADAAGQAAATAQQTANAAQQAASAAQAAAEAAQETADTAQQTANSASTAITNHINAVSAAHPASAISNTPAGNISATTVQAAINELDSKKAGKDQANTWTLRQTFAAGVQDGDGNRDVSLIYSVQHQAHTRSTVLTYTNGRLTKVEEKDGSTVVKTTTLNYDASGRLTSVVETAGGVSVISTFGYDGNGNLISVTRS